MLTENDLKRMFMAGFKISGEGFNFECPFSEQGKDDDYVFACIKPDFEKAMEDLKRK